MLHYKFNSETLEMEIVKIKKEYSNYIIAAVILMLLGFTSGVKVNAVIEKIPIILTTKEQECTPDNVKAYIARLNLKFPKIVYQQVMLESDHLRNPKVKSLNNLLGMEVPTGRPTLGVSAGQRFASYDSWRQSIADYALWQVYMARGIDNESDYYHLLDELYCPHTLPENAGALYSTRLKQILWEDQ